MARYLGPKCKLSRREGTDLFLKSGVKPLEIEVQARGAAGRHRASAARGCPTTACSCARSRSCAACTACSSGSSATTTRRRRGRKGSTGENLLQLLEGRLDNVVYRMGFASTRAEARQLVSHKAIEVNGKTVNIPSYQVQGRRRDRGAREVARSRPESSGAGHRSAGRLPRLGRGRREEDWTGMLKALPERDEILPDINENLVVELYSK